MKFIDTPLKDCYIIEPTIFEDERGYFIEKYNERIFDQATGQNGHFVQDNVSRSTFGVLRGLHLQKGEHAQAKLVSCLEGSVWDVAVDLRKDSPSFGQWYGVELSAENKRQFYVPRGFAHGFAVLSDVAIFSYKCDNFYQKDAEGGILYSDADLAIDWKLRPDQIILSEKDKLQKTFAEANY